MNSQVSISEDESTIVPEDDEWSNDVLNDYDVLFSAFNEQFNPSDDIGLSGNVPSDTTDDDEYDDEYDADEEDYDEYDADEESDQIDSLRNDLTTFEKTVYNSCHELLDFVFDISDKEKITQNEYLETTNKLKNIYISYKKSIDILSNINNVTSLDNEDIKLKLESLACKYKIIRNTLTNEYSVNQKLKMENKNLKDELNSFRKLQDNP